MRAQLVTIYWRDIPAQVNGQAGRNRHQALLPRRFQRAIDRAAMAADLTKAHDYVQEWRRVSQACDGDLAEAAATEAARLDAAFSRERLNRIANAGGVDHGEPDTGDPLAGADLDDENDVGADDVVG